ncbi:DUF5615 family PIN-like protein [Haloferula rosea]|uniref:DUF5615 family PIN-like protein n=1 Tax=Haloferula rosea TaxID=490093 RepID=A0A934VGT8_9BACT|nr:DUF5615 family PIN-like protein [Haloferula rosea]MBK1827930.1 DUF5615 family PIN-like protein [Haloferula rosea]
MRFFLDENFPKSAALLLKAAGHDCFDPRGTALEGAEDDALLAESRRMRAVLLTTDRDFYHTLQHRFPDHTGIVVIALKKPNRQAIVDRLDWFLKNVEEQEIPGRAFQLRDSKWVARPPLPNNSSEQDGAEQPPAR